MMSAENEVVKCLDLTTSLVIASIQNGKFDAKDGQSVAEFFDKVYGEISDCMKLTSPEFVERWNQRRKTN